MPSDYKMPEVCLGMSVIWYDEGNLNCPHAAFVSKVGHESVCLNVMDPASYNFKIRDGSRHKDDPRKKPEEIKEGGLWEYSAITKLLMRIRENDERLFDIELS